MRNFENREERRCIPASPGLLCGGEVFSKSYSRVENSGKPLDSLILGLTSLLRGVKFVPF